MTICPAPDCGVSFRVWRENELVHRAHCHLHREVEVRPADGKAVARLRRSWSSVEPARVQPIPRADLRDDERAQRQRERDEAANPWRGDVPLYEDEATGEDALLATLALILPDEIAA